MPVGDLTPPDRHFSVFLKDITSNIDWSDVHEVIDAFERRINHWYLEPANILIDEMPGKEFVITSIGSILVDTLSQFREGAEAHDPKVFKRFTEDYFPNFDRELPKKIPPHLVVGSNHEVDTVSEAFYSGFRSGLVHSGTVLAFGGHTDETDGEIFQVLFDRDDPMRHCHDKENGEKYPFILINPAYLIDEIESAFNQYLSNLRRDGSKDLRENFAQKIEYDFGEYGKKLKKHI